MSAARGRLTDLAPPSTEETQMPLRPSNPGGQDVVSPGNPRLPPAEPTPRSAKASAAIAIALGPRVILRRRGGARAGQVDA